MACRRRKTRQRRNKKRTNPALALDLPSSSPMPAQEEGSSPMAVSPTPQTVAKLRVDVLKRLLDGGHLREEHVEAAKEIQRVWFALGRGLFPRSRWAESLDRVDGTEPFRDPIDLMNTREERLWRIHYRPWADEVGRLLLGRGGSVSVLQIVLDVVVDNWAPSQLERSYRLRHGTVRPKLAWALWRYAELAGWVQAPGPTQEPAAPSWKAVLQAGQDASPPPPCATERRHAESRAGRTAVRDDRIC